MTLYFLFLLFRVFVMFILWYVIVMAGINVLQMIRALILAPRHITRTQSFEYKIMGSSENVIPISLIVPAYNEETYIVESLKLMLNMNYFNYEIVVINDGSTDSTLETVINAFGLHKTTYPIREQLATKKVRGIYYNPDIPRLRLIDKENGGKCDALNAGINLSRYPYFVSVDADSLLDTDALVHIAMAFMQNKYTVSVGGVIRVANGCSVKNEKNLDISLPNNIWVLLQTLEYFRSFLVGRIGWSSVNSMLIINGSFGAFQKAAVLQVGGYTAGTAGQEMDLVVKLHRYMRKKNYKYQMSFLPDPICWTMVPDSLHDLFRQRRRWQVGFMDIVGRYREMFLNPRFGMPGMLTMPYHFLAEIVSPCIELLGYILIPLAYYFRFLPLESLILFFLASVVFGMITSMGSLVVEEFTNSRFIKVQDGLRLGLLCIAENLFYRQITMAFRVIGILFYGKYRQASWKRQKK